MPCRARPPTPAGCGQVRRATADLNVPQYHDVDAKYRLQARFLSVACTLLGEGPA